MSTGHLTGYTSGRFYTLEFGKASEIRRHLSKIKRSGHLVFGDQVPALQSVLRTATSSPDYADRWSLDERQNNPCLLFGRAAEGPGNGGLAERCANISANTTAHVYPF